MDNVISKKVFYIDPQGGSGNLGMYDYELLSRMKSHEITFFGGKSYDYIPINNVKCRFLFSYGHHKNTVLKGLSYIRTMYRILKEFRKEKPNVIHIQWIRLPEFDIRFYSYLKRKYNVKLVYTVHNILPHESNDKDKVQYRKMYELCDALIVHTNKTKESLIKDFGIKPDKIHVAPHGPLTFKQNENDLNNEKNSLIKKYSLENKLVFSMLGFQSEYKGTDLLVKAWSTSDILKNRNDVCLIIAGEGTHNFISPHGIDNIIAIDGFISNITFNALLKISDVVVLPYRRIEQSGVLLTLVSERKPYCSTNVGELTIPIIKENIGWIIPEISSDSIKNVLEKIVSNKNEVKVKTENWKGWQQVAKLYDWKESASITEKVYASLQRNN